MKTKLCSRRDNEAHLHMKPQIPITKPQRMTKLQTAIVTRPPWCLVLLWNLVIGAWCFLPTLNHQLSTDPCLNKYRLRRGTTAQHSAFTGAEGELTFDTTKKVLVIHDGVTAGGKPVDGFAKLNPGRC